MVGLGRIGRWAGFGEVFFFKVRFGCKICRDFKSNLGFRFKLYNFLGRKKVF